MLCAKHAVVFVLALIHEWIVRCNELTAVVFYPNSTGTMTTLVYEIQELSSIGKVAPGASQEKLFICTSEAVQDKLCTDKDLGLYLINKPTLSGTSIQQQRLDFGASLKNQTTLSHKVNTTGFYCVSVAPYGSNVATGETFRGHVDFVNSFHGQLPASEHPKLYFYGWLTVVYLAMAAVWLMLCFKYKDQIVTVQHFITGTFVLLTVEMACEFAYYSYFNAHAIDYLHFRSISGQSSVTGMARFWLLLTNILEPTRDSLSFFLLLIVAMGYGVVRPTIGSVINKVYLLTALHFICGAMYSVGVILVLLDIASEWVAFFIFPLAFTLTAFYMWILSSLKATILYLSERRQTFKCAMFQRLKLILFGSAAFVSFYLFGMIFYVNFVGPNNFLYQSWKYRWFLLDGILSLLYFVAFALIAWTWRPTGNNMRLAMSDELATDEEAPGTEYEIHTIGPDDLDRDALEVDADHLHQLSQAQSDTGVPPEYNEFTSDGRIELKDDKRHHDIEDDEYDVVFEADHDISRRSYDTDKKHDHEVQRLRLHEEDS